MTGPGKFPFLLTGMHGILRCKASIGAKIKPRVSNIAIQSTLPRSGSEICFNIFSNNFIPSLWLNNDNTSLQNKNIFSVKSNN